MCIRVFGVDPSLPKIEGGRTKNMWANIFCPGCWPEQPITHLIIKPCFLIFVLLYSDIPGVGLVGVD